MSLHDREGIRQRLGSVADPVSFLINLFTHAPVGLAVWTADGRPLLTNQAFLDLFGVEPPPHYNVLEDDVLERNGMLPLFRRAFAGETVQVPTMWFDPRELRQVAVTEGRRVAISMTIFPLFTADGAIEYVAATYKDQTELMLTSERLRLGAERLGLAQQAARVGTFEWDLEAGKVQWTPELEAMHGLSPGQFGGQQSDWEQLLHPEDGSKARAAIEQALRTSAPVESEWRVVWPDGSVHWLAGRFQSLKGADGKPQRLLGVNFEITQHKAKQLALEQSEARKAAVMEAALDAIVSIDDAGIITEFNPAAVRMFGHAREAAIGQSLVELLIPKAQRVHHVAGFQRYLASGHGPILGRRTQVSALRADGSEFPVELTIVSMRVQGTLSFTGYVRDLSEQRAAAEALERSETRLREAEQQLRQSQKMEAIGTLAGGVAHDFNNILSIIMGYVELMLVDMAPGDPWRADLQQVEAAGRRARDLVVQLLAFGRRQVLKPQIVTPADAISSIARMLERIIGEDIELLLETRHSRGSVYVDPGQLEQVLMNLVVNARDAMPHGGKLTIEASDVAIDPAYAAEHLGMAPGPYVVFRVSDNGVGMDRATRARIFEPFFTTKDQGRGTGLGLSTVYGIVKQSGGHIWVYSEPGMGTTFNVYLPRSDARIEPQSTRPPPATLHGSETILLVEDDEQVRRLIAMILRRHGYLTLEAASGAAALEAYERRSGPVHLLLSDVIMPGMSGRQLWERLTELDPAIKVMFMSGYTEDAVLHHGVESSSFDFVQKPVTAATLLEKLRALLDGPAQRPPA